MKIEEGKFYRTRDGRKVGPMVRWSIDVKHPFEVTNKCDKDLVASLWQECGDSDGESYLDLIAEWTDTPTTGTLAELNVRPGDVVEFVRSADGCGWQNERFTGKVFTVEPGGSIHCEEINDGFSRGNDHIYTVISRASGKPTVWQDMTDEKEWSNWFFSKPDGTIKNSLMRGQECDVQIQNLEGDKQVAYRFRIKPKHVRETVLLDIAEGGDGEWFSGSDLPPTHHITFDTLDGKPVCDSIKMEEL